MKKMIITGVLALSLLCVAGIAVAQENRVVVVPLSSTPIAATQTLVSASGDWLSSGLILPPMILHDLIFFASNTGGQPSCEFTMNFVIDQTQSREIRRFNLSLNESTELHFEAGINTSDLRFGTIGGTPCTRNWAAFGYQVP